MDDLEVVEGRGKDGQGAWFRRGAVDACQAGRGSTRASTDTRTGADRDGGGDTHRKKTDTHFSPPPTPPTPFPNTQAHLATPRRARSAGWPSVIKA